MVERKRHRRSSGGGHRTKSRTSSGGKHRRHRRDESVGGGDADDEMDLTKELHPISHYVNDREEMLTEGETILKPRIRKTCQLVIDV